MKKFLISKPFVFSIVLFCVISLFSFSKCFAVTNSSIEDFTSSDINYISKCTNTVSSYMKENNLSKKYYFIITQGDEKFSNKEEFIIVFSDSPSFRDNYFEDCDLLAFWFDMGSTSIRQTKSFTNANMLFDNLKIYYTNYSNDTIKAVTNPSFFQTPTGVLAPELQAVEMMGVLQEIVELLPLILVVVVSFLGLRKALKMLSTLLHQS